jgi:hypothetical protein
MTTTESPCVPIWLAVLVALAGAAVGGFFGSAAGMWLYPGLEFTERGEPHFSELHTTAGRALGAGSGVAVAVGWSLLMRRMSVGASGLKIVANGAGLGVVAGIVSTLVVHVGLAAVAGRWPDPGWLGAVGMYVALMGAPAGLATGLACGLVAWGAAAIARRARASAAPPPGNP